MQLSMKTVTSIVLFCFVSCCHAQQSGVSHYPLEKVLTYYANQSEFIYTIENLSQGFYWDTLNSNARLSHAKIGIVNTYKDSVTIKKVNASNTQIKFKITNKKIAPKDTIWIHASPQNTTAAFTTSCFLYYELNGTPRTFTLKTWGAYSPTFTKKDNRHSFANGYAQLEVINTSGEPLADLFFVRYSSEGAITYPLNVATADSLFYLDLTITPKENLNGYLYSDKYGAIKKVYSDNLHQKKISVKVHHLFEKNELYYYSGSSGKAPYVTNGTYEIKWHNYPYGGSAETKKR